MNIKLSGNMVSFYSIGKSSPVYFFKKSELVKSFKQNGFQISECIEHLQKKNWMDIFDLYKLATLIQKEFPQSTINWEETFYAIEKNKFIDELFEEYQRSIQMKKEKENSIVRNLEIKMQLGIEVEEEGKAGILENLNNNLKFYGLVKKG